MVSQSSLVFCGALPPECWTESNRFGKRSKPASSRWSGAVKKITSLLFRLRLSDSECPTEFLQSLGRRQWLLTATRCKMCADKPRRRVRRPGRRKELRNGLATAQRRRGTTVVATKGGTVTLTRLKITLRGFAGSRYIFPSSIQYHLCNQFIFFFFFSFTETNHVPHFTD